MRDQIEDYVQKTRQCLLRPKQFFVSWNGVLTLAYDGFPPQLESLKNELSRMSDALPVENPGSLWPKTTLGALHDGTRLTPFHLTDLTEICKSLSNELTNLSTNVRHQFHHWSRPVKLLVDDLSLVVYQSRSLENAISLKQYFLSLPLDDSPPTKKQTEYVEGVMQQADGKDYWYHVSKDGNRANHYSSDVSVLCNYAIMPLDAALGVTLVHNLKSLTSQPELLSNPDLYTTQTRSYLAGLVSKFRKEVDEKLPSLYHWFNPASLHVTVRGIIN